MVNGRGTTDKLEGIRLFFYLNSEILGTVTADATGAFELSLATAVEEGMDVAHQFKLYDNYPNPFNPSTTISYSLDRAGEVSLVIYNILGQKVRFLVQQYQGAGEHRVAWDGLDADGVRCTYGTYLYRLKFRDQIRTGKMLYVDSPVNFALTRPGQLSRSSFVSNTLEVQIKDRDVVDTTHVYHFDVLPSSIELHDVPVHVYPFLKVSPDTISLMSGESAEDTLNIYFENPIEILPLDLDFEYNILNDSLVRIQYRNVNKVSDYLLIKEINNPRVSYGKVYFNLDPRLTLKDHKMRRAYIGIDYKEYLIVRNNRGIAELTLLNPVPDGLTYENGKITGSPAEVSDGMHYVEIVDDRNIVVQDSFYLWVGTPYDIPMNDYVVDVLEEYPRDGTHRYLWVNSYDGVTRDVLYENRVVARENPDGSGTCFCCGLTFEVFFRSLQRLFGDLKQDQDVNGMVWSQMRDLLVIWFVQQMWGEGPGPAVEKYGIGDKIYSFADARKGDFLQYWRTTGSGHSVIFIEWMLNTATGDTTGFRYWSTQGSTNGINYSTEYFTGKGGTVDPDLTFFARLRSPDDFKAFSTTLAKPDANVPVIPHPALDNTNH
jgi:hypothetical protein